MGRSKFSSLAKTIGRDTEGIMPTLSFSEDEIEPDGNISAIVNPAGLAYVGRKHKGKNVRIMVMKESE